MDESKQRSEQHLIDADGEKLLRSVLPRHWVLREYRPDYGLDFSLEIFATGQDKAKGPKTYQTLGEHLFIQLKSVQKADPKKLVLHGRMNVEKEPEKPNKDDVVGEIDTVRFSLETSELVTVERMGIGVPVLLVVADLSTSKCYFVCLNDYVDKILIPRHGDYTKKSSRTIHVPTSNDLAKAVPGLVALRWYAKRAKLFAAFHRFAYQEHELQYESNFEELQTRATYFASKIARYDFWDDTEMCGLIGMYGGYVRKYLETGKIGLTTTDVAKLYEHLGDVDEEQLALLKDQFAASEIGQLWRLLATLPKTYEDVWREWFLPTSLGFLTS